MRINDELLDNLEHFADSKLWLVKHIEGMNYTKFAETTLGELKVNQDLWNDIHNHQLVLVEVSECWFLIAGPQRLLKYD